MPIIKGAIKKLKQDRVRTARNKVAKASMRSVIKSYRLTSSQESLSQAFSALDKAVKHKLIKKSKAARIKSRLTLKAVKSSLAPKKSSLRKSAKKSK